MKKIKNINFNKYLTYKVVLLFAFSDIYKCKQSRKNYRGSTDQLLISNFSTVLLEKYKKPFETDVKCDKL